MIIEMRTYTLKPGKRSEFLSIFKAESAPAHQKIGMKILGPFLSIEDNNVIFWMRAFPDAKTREQMRNEFYEGKLWKEELEEKLMPMIDKFDVTIVDAPNGLGEWN
jgi:NIPSNAP